MDQDDNQDQPEYSKSLLMRDEDGRQYWIFVDVPQEMLGTYVTEEQLLSLRPEICYLDEIEYWSKEALAKVETLLNMNMLLSMAKSDVLTNTDRLTFARLLNERKGK
jgi:hypothetical protein